MQHVCNNFCRLSDRVWILNVKTGLLQQVLENRKWLMSFHVCWASLEYKQCGATKLSIFQFQMKKSNFVSVSCYETDLLIAKQIFCAILFGFLVVQMLQFHSIVRPMLWNGPVSFVPSNMVKKRFERIKYISIGDTGLAFVTTQIYIKDRMGRWCWVSWYKPAMCSGSRI